jgi:selenide,water dikinase
MGGEPYCAMNIVCYPIKKMPKEYLREILRGGFDKILEAGAFMAGGHSVEDDEIKYGLSVSGIVDPQKFATNKGLSAGDVLLLTKPIGTGVLATALKGDFGDAEAIQEQIVRWAGRLNKGGAAVIRELELTGATDVTGFGLGGHLLEMVRASGVRAEIMLGEIPFLDQAVELAGMGMLPAGSLVNKKFCSSAVMIEEGADPISGDLVFDAQTSGGLILSVPEEKVSAAEAVLASYGDLAARVGRVYPREKDEPLLKIRK